nr:hypothetical protein [uncultured Rhodopila sp.]
MNPILSLLRRPWQTAASDRAQRVPDRVIENLGEPLDAALRTTPLPSV